MLVLACADFAAAADKPPRSPDKRLVVELFAEHPQIVTPTGIAVDGRYRVFVAESHTHFRPDDYDGPKHDRILILEDTDGDGRADRSTVFHEGFTYLMDLEFDRQNTLYAATRSDIYRLRDNDGDNHADEVTNIVHLETTGTYPHNGVSGLAFNFAGELNFGLGENLGHAYTLVGADGTRISGGGEGGSTYRVGPDGKGLVRTSTGWWNPWGMCVDAFGRVFGTDNDPGESPPCRLIQVIDGADYGYEYRYGRSGLHPLVSWTGDMPGTLPMISGTGEAPCGILAYESVGLPQADYRGHLLVASWADHRIEHYPITQEPGKGLVGTHREVLVEGEGDFRPVGLAVAPDGDVYFTDWVSSSYTLHKQGRIWRIRSTTDRGITGLKRDELEWEAIQLAGRDFPPEKRTRTWNSAKSSRERSALLQAFILHDAPLDYEAVARKDDEIALRVLALRHLLEKKQADPAKWLGDDVPTAVRGEAVLRLDAEKNAKQLIAALDDRDPLIFQNAVQALSRQAADKPEALAKIERQAPLGVLLALKRNPKTRQAAAKERLGKWLADSDARVRFAAVKWVADDKLTEYKPRLEALLREELFDYRPFLATVAALDVLDGKQPSDRPSPERLLARISDENSSPAVRRLALRLIDPAYKPLRLAQLESLLKHPDAALRLEAVRTLAEYPDAAKFSLLERLARDESQSVEVRAAAVAGLAAEPEAHLELLLDLAAGKDRALRDEGLRSLVGAKLDAPQRARLEKLQTTSVSLDEAIRRVLGKPLVQRPKADDTVSWLAMLPQRADPRAGERIFFGQKVGTCAKCHQYDGRGNSVGPSLTMMHSRLAAEEDPAHVDAGRRWLLQTILKPSREMAPQYTPWQIVTTSGKVLTGLPRRKGGNSEAYLGLDGKEFSVKKGEIESHREIEKSVMPDDLLKTLTPQEIADLLAFLTAPR